MLQIPRLDVLVPRAVTDDELLGRACDIVAVSGNALATALRPRHDAHATISMAGGCGREIYAKLHGLLDLPDDGENKLAKMENGSLMGFWLCALEQVAIVKYVTDYNKVRGTKHNVEFEVEGERVYNGVLPGHCDLGVYLDAEPWFLTENKTTYQTSAISPRAYYEDQSSLYAHGGVVFPTFVIITLGPAVQASYDKHTKSYTENPKLVQHVYTSENYHLRAEIEANRLIDIQNSDTMPPADPPEAWRCKYCRFSACEKNRNPLKEILA